MAGIWIDPLLEGFPACAGIDPLNMSMLILSFRFPRMRGDRPSLGFDDS